MFKKTMMWFVPSELLVIIFCIIKYHSVTLLQYINVSFFIGGILLFLSLSFFLISSGFFDITHMAFRKAFGRNKTNEGTEEEMRPLSQLVDVQYFPLMINGAVVLLLMLFALFFYYR